MSRGTGVSGIARVVSGGQTGADRAALDAAAVLGVPRGGWCPRGGAAEDLPEPPGLLACYPELRETNEADPAARTRLNVRDSDAVLVLHLPGSPATGSPGTRLTLEAARKLGRAVLVAATDEEAAVRAWLGALPSGAVLDVAGPRESEQPGLYAAARGLLLEVLREP